MQSASFDRRDRPPPRLLPVLYFACAHLCLVLAFAVAVARPATLTQFYYQPRTLAVVHLVTLGWITLSILGAIHVIGPMALRMPLPVRRLDYLALAFVVSGVFGMVGHFLIAEYGGLSWSAGLVAAGLGHVAVRVARALRGAPIDAAVRLHIALAFINLLAAAAAGLLLGLNKARPFLEVAPLSLVLGHAHLAALGWAVMMVVGTGYRLLPMILPSALPRGPGLYASAILLQTGALGLFGAFLAGGRWLPLFALAALAGFAVFFLHVRWMRRHPRRPAAGLRPPDYGALHAFQALGYAGLGAACGLLLSFTSTGSAAQGLAAAYGLFGLVGFLSQMVVGIGARVLPMFAVSHANRGAGTDRRPVLPHEMADRRLQALSFYLWTAGVPVLAGGLLVEAAPAVEAGAVLLLAAAILGAVNDALVLRHAFPARTSPGTTGPV